MSPTGSILSTNSSLVGLVTKATHNSNPGIKVLIDNHTPQKTYTTFDAVTGVVQITAPQNVRFDEMRITLEGRAKSFIDGFSASGVGARSTARQTFLKLVMPLKVSDYPQPRVAEAGITYTFPFNFNIPEQLLPRACAHKVESDQVGRAHLHLPPSIGGKNLAGLDDLAPAMSKITYAVNAQVIKTTDSGDGESVLIEGCEKLRVVPAIAEAPPLSFLDDDRHYVLSKAKTLRKGIFSGALGRITVSAAQTKALMLPPPGSSGTSVITMATLNLRFYPSNPSSEPPKLGGVTTKIKASTFFSVTGLPILPSFSTQRGMYEGSRGVYSTSVPLSSRCVESVTWTKHDPHGNCLRRDSESSTSSVGSGSIEHRDDVLHYTAQIFAPITLPSSKSWVPSFNSCIISRVYTIDLALTIHTPGTGVPASSLSLHLPIQIASAGNPEGRAQLTATEAAEELASVNEFFTPRVIEVPHERLVGNSLLRPTASSHLAQARGQPPTYDDFLPPRTVTPGKC